MAGWMPFRDPSLTAMTASVMGSRARLNRRRPHWRCLVDSFHREIPVDNTSAARYPDITVRATTSPGVSEAGGHAFWAWRAVPSTRMRREAVANEVSIKQGFWH